MEGHWPSAGCLALIAWLIVRWTYVIVKRVRSESRQPLFQHAPPPVATPAVDPPLATPPDASPLILGQHAITGERWPDALRHFTAVLEQERTPAALLGLAEAYLQFDREDDALALIDEALALYRYAQQLADYRLYLLRGRAFYGREDYELALYAFEHAETARQAAGQPPDLELAAWRGCALAHAGRKHDADFEFQRLHQLSLKPPHTGHAGLHRQLGILACYQGRLPQMREHFQRATAVRHHQGLLPDPEVLYFEGIMASLLKRQPEAIRYFLQSGQARTKLGLPRAPMTQVNHAKALYKLKRYGEALSLLDETERLCQAQHQAPPQKVAMLRAEIYLGQKNFPQAARCLEQALAELAGTRIDPGAGMLVTIAEVQLKCGNRTRARELLRKVRADVLAADPGYKFDRAFRRLEARAGCS